LTLAVVRSGDEAVKGHRHVQHETAHRSAPFRAIA
jgi:hypothetical protein